MQRPLLSVSALSACCHLCWTSSTSSQPCSCLSSCSFPTLLADLYGVVVLKVCLAEKFTKTESGGSKLSCSLVGNWLNDDPSRDASERGSILFPHKRYNTTHTWTTTPLNTIPHTNHATLSTLSTPICTSTLSAPHFSAQHHPLHPQRRAGSVFETPPFSARHTASIAQSFTLSRC